jgi:hypothetical protein
MHELPTTDRNLAYSNIFTGEKQANQTSRELMGEVAGPIIVVRDHGGQALL